LPSCLGRRNLNGRSTFLWNVGIYEPHYTVPYPRRPIKHLFRSLSSWLRRCVISKVIIVQEELNASVFKVEDLRVA
jgi:hypothetical protein